MGNKKALPEYGEPYPLSSSDLVVSSGHLWVKVAGQGRWPEGLAYRSGRIFVCEFRLAYDSRQMQLLLRLRLMPPCVIVGDWGGYEATVSRLLAQISTPMTAISEGKNSWVSRACVGSNYTVNMDKLY